MIQVIVFIVLTVAFAYASGQVAKRRGRSARAWEFAGLTIGPIALLLVALLPRRRNEGTA
jgi:hypothetical protein